MFRLLKGFGITLNYFFKPKVTVQYPEQKPYTPDRFRGIQRFFPDLCIVCNMCVNACPTDVIKLTGKPHPDNPKKKVIDTYNIDFQGCILCDFCTEVCPTQAIVMSTKYDNLSDYSRDPKSPFAENSMYKDIEWLKNNEVYGNYVVKEEKVAAKKENKVVEKTEEKVERKAPQKEATKEVQKDEPKEEVKEKVKEEVKEVPKAATNEEPKADDKERGEEK